MRAWWVGLLLAVLAVMIGVYPSAPEPVSGSVAGATAPVLPAATRQPTSAHAVLHARDLGAALADYALAVPAPELRRLRAEVDAACRVLVLLELDGRGEPDVRRRQARSELAQRCAGLPVPSMYVPAVDTRLPADDELEQAAGVAALADLRQARTGEALADAWLEAYRHDALPQDAIFPDRRRLLPAEAEALIKVVVDWRECERLQACGPDSLFALRVCALHGCMPGSDVRSAWHQALSPRDFESVQAIHAWLHHWQSGGAP